MSTRYVDDEVIVFGPRIHLPPHVRRLTIATQDIDDFPPEIDNRSLHELTILSDVSPYGGNQRLRILRHIAHQRKLRKIAMCTAWVGGSPDFLYSLLECLPSTITDISLGWTESKNTQPHDFWFLLPPHLHELELPVLIVLPPLSYSFTELRRINLDFSAVRTEDACAWIHSLPHLQSLGIQCGVQRDIEAMVRAASHASTLILQHAQLSRGLDLTDTHLRAIYIVFCTLPLTASLKFPVSLKELHMPPSGCISHPEDLVNLEWLDIIPRWYSLHGVHTWSGLPPPNVKTLYTDSFPLPALISLRHLEFLRMDTPIPIEVLRSWESLRALSLPPPSTHQEVERLLDECARMRVKNVMCAYLDVAQAQRYLERVPDTVLLQLDTQLPAAASPELMRLHERFPLCEIVNSRWNFPALLADTEKWRWRKVQLGAMFQWLTPGVVQWLFTDS